MNSFSVMERDVRFKISWLQLLVEEGPLFPEPFCPEIKAGDSGRKLPREKIREGRPLKIFPLNKYQEAGPAPRSSLLMLEETNRSPCMVDGKPIGQNRKFLSSPL